MSDPTTQHEICQGCHTHQTINRTTGRFVTHVTTEAASVPCSGSGQLPVQPLAGRYAPTSQHASCPAATGDGARCRQFPDGAHRCGDVRGHTASGQRLHHTCTCTTQWMSVTGTLDDMTRALNAGKATR